jgi:DHA2 family multidrug resistance protein
MLESGSQVSLALMDQSINQQAQMIAYLNDFKLMFVATLLVVPLLLLIRPMRSVAGETLAHAAAD